MEAFLDFLDRLASTSGHRDPHQYQNWVERRIAFATRLWEFGDAEHRNAQLALDAIEAVERVLMIAVEQRESVAALVTQSVQPLVEQADNSLRSLTDVGLVKAEALGADTKQMLHEVDEEFNAKYDEEQKLRGMGAHDAPVH